MVWCGVCLLNNTMVNTALHKNRMTLSLKKCYQDQIIISQPVRARCVCLFVLSLSFGRSFDVCHIDFVYKTFSYYVVIMLKR